MKQIKQQKVFHLKRVVQFKNKLRALHIVRREIKIAYLLCFSARVTMTVR